MEYPRCVVISFYDWEALYVDGELAAEGLRVRISDLIDAVFMTDIKVRDIRYCLSNKKMEEVLDTRRLHDTYCPPTLIGFGEENIKHVRV